VPTLLLRARGDLEEGADGIEIAVPEPRLRAAGLD
jgi:hypothetical protein